VVPKLALKAGSGLLFSFFDNRAEMRTVDSMEQVVDTARAQVMVTVPGRQLPGDLVYIADLDKHKTWVEPRGIWLDRVMPKTSVSDKAKLLAQRAQSRARKRRRPRRRRRRRRRPKAIAQAPTPQATGAPTPARKAAPRVILFSTSWCPSCKTARAFFQQRGIPFQELDVEKNQQAQQLYINVAKQAGLRPGVVPVIIVGSRVFQGFSQPQIEAALRAG
jgi:glutaredoxin